MNMNNAESPLNDQGRPNRLTVALSTIASASAVTAGFLTGVVTRGVWRATHRLYKLLPGVAGANVMTAGRDDGPP
ncbi:MAG TPA: hypothetical protein PLS22_09580, partial [Aquabacterium sp.]|nr:hypothetical protein [Aquabacterium sp.]